LKMLSKGKAEGEVGGGGERVMKITPSLKKEIIQEESLRGREPTQVPQGVNMWGPRGDLLSILGGCALWWSNPLGGGVKAVQKKAFFGGP